MSLVELARFDNRIEAEVARLNLQAEGIDGVLFDAEIGHFFGGWFLPIRLMVLDEDVDQARTVLGIP